MLYVWSWLIVLCMLLIQNICYIVFVDRVQLLFNMGICLFALFTILLQVEFPNNILQLQSVWHNSIRVPLLNIRLPMINKYLPNLELDLDSCAEKRTSTMFQVCMRLLYDYQIIDPIGIHWHTHNIRIDPPQSHNKCTKSCNACNTYTVLIQAVWMIHLSCRTTPSTNTWSKSNNKNDQCDVTTHHKTMRPVNAHIFTKFLTLKNYAPCVLTEAMGDNIESCTDYVISKRVDSDEHTDIRLSTKYDCIDIV